MSKSLLTRLCTRQSTHFRHLTTSTTTASDANSPPVTFKFYTIDPSEATTTRPLPEPKAQPLSPPPSKSHNPNPPANPRNPALQALKRSRTQLAHEITTTQSQISTLRSKLFQPQPLPAELENRSASPKPHTPEYFFTGTVSRTMSMVNTVQITREAQVWDKFLKKWYTRPTRVLAHDPNFLGFLREGDVVEYGLKTEGEKEEKRGRNRVRVRETEARLREGDVSGKMVRAFLRVEAKREEMRGRRERGVRFVVRRVVTPFGVPLGEREEVVREVKEVEEVKRKGRGRFSN